MPFHKDPVRLGISLLFLLMLVPFGYVTGGFLGIKFGMRVWFAWPFSMTLVWLGNIWIPALWKFVNSSIKVTTFFMHYDAERRVSLSRVESLISAGEYDDAAAEIDSLLAAHGLDAGLCRLAIDHHLGKFGTPSRGEALLRRMRSELPAQYEGIATQRLIDLYMMSAETYPKAMTELRRLIARFPGTPEASGAQKCLERIRETHFAA